MAKHNKLVDQAKEAINSVFGDRSVGQSATRNSLEELQELIESNLEALKASDDEDDLDADR